MRCWASPVNVPSILKRRPVQCVGFLFLDSRERCRSGCFSQHTPQHCTAWLRRRAVLLQHATASRCVSHVGSMVTSHACWDSAEARPAVCHVLQCPVPSWTLSPVGSTVSIAFLLKSPLLSLQCRFMNSPACGDNIKDPAAAQKFIRTQSKYEGMTPMGSQLEAKILHPFLGQALFKRNLAKPMLVGPEHFMCTSV